jgi:hypothetical protein
MKKRLSTWNGRILSIGGRIILINSILSSLPLYFFFFKAPSCVLKELVSIQNDFLWGGGSEEKKRCWVSWDHICQPEKTGGLGIKKLELFNSSLLLCKWKWFFCEIFFCIEKAWRDLKNLQFGGEIYGA